MNNYTKMSDEDKDLAEAALDLYGEPTIEDSEDERLPNGQSSTVYPEGFAAKIARRQAMQENGINIGLI